jgi:hypothetical protein
MREIGSSMVLSTAAAIFINVALSQSTRPVSKKIYHLLTWFDIAVVDAVVVIVNAAIAITATHIPIISNTVTMSRRTHITLQLRIRTETMLILFFSCIFSLFGICIHICLFLNLFYE